VYLVVISVKEMKFVNLNEIKDKTNKLLGLK